MKYLLHSHLHNSIFTGSLFHFINNSSSSSSLLEELDVIHNYLTGSVNDIMSLLSLHFQYLKVLKLDYIINLMVVHYQALNIHVHNVDILHASKIKRIALHYVVACCVINFNFRR